LFEKIKFFRIEKVQERKNFLIFKKKKFRREKNF